jgi:mannitol/fructose-specific phosphotransferase system IIA component (Ntr-type)
MRISDLLSEETITTSLTHRDKYGIIEELLDLAMKLGKIKNRSVALQAIIDRENLMSTGLEKGVAIPHTKTAAATGMAMALGISREGLDFQSADGQPSHLIFLLVAPADAAGPNVQVLAQIARLTTNITFRDRLKEASSPNAAYEIITKAEK